MIQTRGKIPNLFLQLILITFLTIIASADVKVSVNSSTIYKDDVVNFTITADGKDIEFPKLTTIGGQLVTGSAKSQSVTIINGDTTRSISATYNFVASKSFIIPQYIVKVDGVEYKTKELPVKVLEPKASEDGAEFVLDIALDKKVAYVGEPITLSLSFKAKKNAHAKKIELDEPKLENFWVKKIEKVENSTEDDYNVQTIHYKLFPQKSGEYTIPALKALIGKIATQRQQRDMFFDPFFSSMGRLEWQKVYSNGIKLEVKPLPNGLELFGNYQIQATVDSQKIEANKPVNLTISIKGEGNIDDVKKFNLNIDTVNIYADEPTISTQETHGIYQGEFTQKIALVGDRNFTIPPLELEYFDKATRSVKKVSTKAIDIEVTGTDKIATPKASSIEVNPTTQTIQAPQKVETKVIIKKEDAYLKYLFLAIGFILGIALMSLINYLKNRTNKSEMDIVKSIRKAKDDKALFTTLLPYAKESQVISNALDKLEENLYKNGTHKIDKEELMEVFE